MTKDRSRTIAGYPSIFLDFLRICASFTVLYIHAFDRWFPTEAHSQNDPGEPSHVAVIVFFVLSGYVIAHTTISKNRGKMQYAQARLTRLSSIVLPALLITAIIQLIIGKYNPNLLAEYSRGFSLLRYILSALFINEFWFFSAAPPLNGSLWSLSFEFWYYAIFGCWFFRLPGWKSLLIVIVVGLFAGPKILLMMPVWLAGYMAYRLPRPKIKSIHAWGCVFLLLLTSWLVVVTVPSIPYKIGYKPLYYANQFVTDWITGFFIAAMFWILPTEPRSTESKKGANFFRYIADLTFPLYVLHFPLLILWRCLFGFKINNSVQLWEAIISVTLTAGLIGAVFEKFRPMWGEFFRWLLTLFKNQRQIIQNDDHST